MSEPALHLPAELNLTEYYLTPHLEAGRGERPYMHCEGEVLSYQALFEDACRWVNVLTDLGVQREQRVVMLMLEGLDYARVFWGTIRAGAIPVPLNTMLKTEDYRYYLQDSRARALVVDAALWPQIAPLLPDLPLLAQVVISGDAASSTGSTHPRLSSLLAAAKSEAPAARMSIDEPAMWAYTSGSTGSPKAVVHLQRGVFSVMERMPAVYGLTPQDLSFSVAKMFFAYGLGNSVLFPMKAGSASVVQPGRPAPEKAFEVLMRYRPSVFYGVPTLFNGMLALYEAWQQGEQSPPATLPRLEHLRFSASAGEALPEALFTRWQQYFGSPVVDGIGSTEMLHMFISNRPHDARSGCTGKLVPGYQARIVDEQERELPAGEIGALWVKGDSAASHYWNKYEKTQQTMLGAWLVTGDKFHRDEDGWYYYHGRNDDMMKISGSWVSPMEIENALLSHEAVLESAVVGQLNHNELLKPKAYVVLQPHHTPSPALAESLQAHVKAALAGIKVPQWVEFVADLPKTATGKIRRFQLRERD